MTNHTYKWLIVGGCPRSGTTLLNFLLNSNPQIRLTNEISLNKLIQGIENLFYRERALSNSQERAKGKKEKWKNQDVLPFVFQFKDCAIPVLKSLYDNQFYPEFVPNEIIYYGDKYPKYYVDNFDKVKNFLGEVRVIHISRNPLDVVNSMMRRAANSRRGLDTWDSGQNITTSCEEWRTAWNFISTYTKKSNFLHLKYEDLVFNSNITLKQIAEYLDVKIEFDEQILVKDFHYERDYLTQNDISFISQYLRGIDECWQEPLEDLVSCFSYIDQPDMSSLSLSLTEDNREKEKKQPNKILKKITRTLGQKLISTGERMIG